MKDYLKFIIPAFLFIAFTLNPGDGDKKFPKILNDDNSKYTNVGNIGITVTNFGTYGHGFVLWPDQPSAEFPLGSGIEHLFDGGLWVGNNPSFSLRLFYRDIVNVINFRRIIELVK